MNWYRSPIEKHIIKIATWNPINGDQEINFDYIDLSAIDKDRKEICTNHIVSITAKNAPSRARQLVKVNDVLVATVRPNLNGVALVPDFLDDATASTGYCVLRANNQTLDYLYLFYWVQTENFVSDMMSKATGATYPAVSDKIIRESEIPLPPLPEQQRIAAILDKADAIRRKRQQAIQLADEFLRSVFLEMFGDPVTNPKGFDLKPITYFATVITGNAFKSKDYVEDCPDSVRLCRGANTLTGYFDWKDTVFWSKHELNGLEPYLLKAGDVVLAMDRPWISTGLKVAMWGDSERDTYLVQRVARLRPKKDIYSNFILSCVKSMAFEKHCFPTETTVPHISPVELKSFMIPYPGENALQNFHKLTNKMQHSVLTSTKAAEYSNHFFNALSQRAFAGEL